MFARFIPTAHYVADHLKASLKNVAVEVVTGELPSEERAIRVAALSEAAESGPKVLVATDCLSEGVNLQDAFQAVVHYDLAWNPTRHEQREGRVDRFGQTAPEVKALLLYGEDNGIDGIVLDVLLRKHEKIRKDLGISVPVPPQSDQVLAALLEGILMRGQQADQLTLDLGVDTAAQTLDEQWRSTAEAEKASRTRYAHARIRPDEVQAAVDAARDSLGTPDSVAGFVRTVLEETGTQLTPTTRGFTADLALAPVGLVDALGRPAKPLPFVTDLPAAAGHRRADPHRPPRRGHRPLHPRRRPRPRPARQRPTGPPQRRDHHQPGHRHDRGPAGAVPHPPAPARTRPDHHPPGRGGPRPRVLPRSGAARAG